MEDYLDKQMDIDFFWFIDHNVELHDKYGDCYLLIQNCKVLGVYYNAGDALKDQRERGIVEKSIVQDCDGTEKCYTAIDYNYHIREKRM